MGTGRRRLLVAVAVLLPALLVYGARQIGAPSAASDLPAGGQPVFVGRVTPESTHVRPNAPMRVTVEIRADRRVDLAGIRVMVADGEADEGGPLTFGPELRTVPFEVRFPGPGAHSVLLQVRLTPDAPWVDLPPSNRIIVG